MGNIVVRSNRVREMWSAFSVHSLNSSSTKKHPKSYPSTYALKSIFNYITHSKSIRNKITFLPGVRVRDELFLLSCLDTAVRTVDVKRVFSAMGAFNSRKESSIHGNNVAQSLEHIISGEKIETYL